MHCHRYADGWEVRCGLPINPNVREAEGFRFSRRVEVLRYSLTTYRRLMVLDRKIGTLIRDAWTAGAFPKRTEHLFFVGERQRPPANNRLRPPGETVSRHG